MWVLCLIVTFFCTYWVEQVFHNSVITIGLGMVMGLSSGVFMAIDERRQREGDGKD
jgi:hypothetical protein